MSITSFGTSKLDTSGKLDCVKLAIQSEPMLPQKQPLLLDVALNSPLTSIVKDVCAQWGVDNPERYALKYADPPPNATTAAKFGYITEENRYRLNNGDILRIALTPAISAEEAFSKIRSRNAEERKPAINQLQEQAKDKVFALEFIKLDGIVSLMSMVESSQLGNEIEMLQVASVLGVFQELMEHGIVSWNALSENFVKKLINFIDKTLHNPSYFRAGVISKTCSILESVVLNSPKFYTLIAKELSVSSTISFLDKGHTDVKYSTLAFINAMISKASDREAVMRELTRSRFNRVLLDAILNHFQGNVPQELAHELYVYQSYVMNLVEGRMKKRFAAGDLRMEEDLRLLPARAFPEDYGAAKSRVSISEQHWKQLGFMRGNPQIEFDEVPPGILALDCMVYFAKTKHETFTRLLFAHIDNQCPFAQTSIALCKVLCQIFRIGEPPSDVGYEFIPVLVWHEEPFKEVFCVAIQLLFRTWREMRASVLDLEKVMVVVAKQISMVLQAGSNLTSFDVLKTRLFDLSYKKITASEENSRLLDDTVLRSKPVMELSKRIKPEIIQLVKEERLRHLVEGAEFPAFPKTGRKVRDQFFYCRLSPNHKVLHFGDCSGGAQPPPIESLDKKIQVSEMRLETGANCPHASSSRRVNIQYIFSIFYEGDEHLDFVAPNETVYNIWVDGLSVLLGKRMPSNASEEDVETLLNMDLKLRLLDIENIAIPSQIPSVPKEPADYDFYYKLDN